MTEDELILQHIRKGLAPADSHVASAIANALKARNLVARLSCRVNDTYATVIKVETRGKQGRTSSELRQP